ncbi:transglutaminase-like domain-containing protein [Novosphingobium huizhouense]|uniref:transglutaminase-like domain-containing protein n=1 Tax=Novosphingobium huizhouense TaxID=2866625 RepID=UPI001CD81EB0|nr:transglutaminase family protein [Novosphingobium huizhouense]
MPRQLSIDVLLDYQFDEPADVLLQIEAAPLPDQTIVESSLDLADGVRVAALDGVGERIWLHRSGRMRVNYRASVEITRAGIDLAPLAAVAHRDLPGETIPYLMPSRYCPSDRFQAFALRTFGEIGNGAGVLAIRDWIAGHLDYVAGVSNSGTCATDTFVTRQGVCRDYAHLMVTLARAAGLPARFASVYAAGVKPQDFHAVAQVWLEGAWHIVDATGMARCDETAIIGVGRDAADVAFLTAFGFARYVDQRVAVAAA